MKKHLGLFGAAFVGGIMSLSFGHYFNNEASKSTMESSVTDSNPQLVGLVESPVQNSLVDLSVAAEDVVKEVVHIKVTQEGQEMVQIDPFQYFFNGNAQGRKFKTPDKQGSGSGVVISEDGYIVTNNHVVSGADQIEVVLNNNESYTANVVGTDPSTDLALLKIEASDLSAIEVGNSDNLKLGEWVLAVGNPYNLNSTVTAGIISAKARNINILQQSNGNPPIEAFIQTDAAVNPGNSGGALVNAQGQLIGINSAIKSPTGSYSGYSFAIPVNIVKKVVSDIMEFGVVQRAFIGVSIRDVDAELAETEELKVVSGVFVAEVSDNGAAKEAGIEAGDVITMVNKTKVNTVAELQSQIGLFNPGDEVAVEVNRKGKSKSFMMKLRNSNGNTNIVTIEDNSLAVLGARFTDVDNGVQVSDISAGKIKNSGMQNGFIITQIDNKPITDVASLKNALKSKKGGTLFSGVYPNGVKKYYGIGL